jgi:uncharacterized UBP type Zn finger protein
MCDKTDNLWLNLTDGSILCGRKYFDGKCFTICTDIQVIATITRLIHSMHHKIFCFLSFVLLRLKDIDCWILFHKFIAITVFSLLSVLR